MTEAKEESTKKPLKLSRPGRLELKKTVETGEVRQSFSHGRTKAVMVEVKKKRTFRRGESGRMAEVTEERQIAAGGPDEAGARGVSALSDVERAARARALEEARGTVPETPAEPAPFEEQPREPAAEEAAVAEPAVEAPPVEEVPGATAEAERARREADEMARQLAEQEVRGKIKTTPSTRVPPKPAVPAEPVREEEAEEPRAKRGKGDRKSPAAPKRSEPRRRAGKLTISQALEEGDGRERVRSLASVRRAREREKLRQRQQPAAQEHKKRVREVVIPESITVQELANRMAARGADVVKALMKLDVMATITQAIDGDTAELVVTEFGYKPKRVSEADVEIGLEGAPDDPASLRPRPPVVTVMGHVDHGKTSLLDALRETDVTAKEAGGITQHIGAYQVALPTGDKVTFIDTPGHAAFTAMRARGAKVTDIVVLVVAADDGVRPQTEEAIAHAAAAEVPIVVAINKMDKRNAEPDRVRQELLQHEIVVEELGGEVLTVEVSATKKINLDKLVEAILLQAELLELRANPDRPAQGVVVEAKLEHGRGPVATVLVQRGTLKVGEVFIAGAEWGRVRALIDDRGEAVKSAGPSMPVEVLGLNAAPSAGDDFAVVEGEPQAREISEYRRRVIKRDAVVSRGTVEQMLTKIAAGETEELPLVVKGDVQGSVEAITGALQKLGTDEVAVRILHGGVGGINESDVSLAKASDGAIIGFNVRASKQARDLAQRENVDIRYYSIIYDVTDDIKAALSGLLAPALRENILGSAEIREVFKISKVGNIAGCYVTNGMVRRGAGVRLLRDDVVIHEGKLGTLRRFKDEVREVKEGFECGMGFENYNDIKVGDVIECYEVEEVAREL